jgi:hypothetical protein
MFCLAACGLTAWIAETVQLGRVRASVRPLELSVADQLERWTSASNRLARTREQYDQFVASEKAAFRELSSIAEESNTMAALPTKETTEGQWPEGKPYFYLSKPLLSVIGYPMFDISGELSDTAVKLFGMSLREQIEVNLALREARRQMEESEVMHAEPVKMDPSINTPDHQEISYHIPALTNEWMEIQNGLKARLSEVLGEQRSSFFIKPLEAIPQKKSELKERTLTYSADRQPDGAVHHTIKVATADGSSTSLSGAFGYPINETHPVWPYRFLFGNEPLIPVP